MPPAKKQPAATKRKAKQPPHHPHTLLARPEIVDEICQRIAGEALPTKHAVQLSGISEDTHLRWIRHADEPNAPTHLTEYRDRIINARSERTQKLVSIVMRNAVGWRRTKTGKDGEVTEQWLESDPASARWLLERTNPGEYGNKQLHEHTGLDGAPIDIRIMLETAEADPLPPA